MATAGDIVVNLTANSTQFTKGIGQAKSDLGELSSALNSAKAYLTGFLSFSFAKSAFSEIKSIVGAVDDLAAASERIGVTTRFLSELEYAAKLSDTSVEALHTGLSKMVKVLGEASLGENEGVVKMLQRAGMDAAELARIGPEKAFLAIADAASRIEDPMQRAAFVTEIFGKGGQEMIGILAKGEEGIQAFREEAQRMGASIGEDMANKAGEADDAFKRMDAAITVIKNNLAIEFVPVVVEVAGGFKEMATNIKEVISFTKELLTQYLKLERFFVASPIGALAGFNKAAGNIENALKLNAGGAAARGLFGGGFPKPPIDLGKFDDGSVMVPIIAKPIKMPVEIESIKYPTRTDNPASSIFSREGFSLMARALQRPAQNIEEQQLAQQKRIGDGIDSLIKNVQNIGLPQLGEPF